VRELGVPRGADFRKKFPVGSEVQVVFVSRGEGGKVTFSIARVAGVEERANYREFTQRGAQPSAQGGGLGALGQELQRKFGLQAPTDDDASEPQPKPAAAGSQSPTPQHVPAD